MRRPLLLATASLAALTAVSLLGAVVAVRPPGIPAEADGPREAANRVLAYHFYEAANAAIATGDPAPLAALLAPAFVERGAPPDAEPDREGLVRRLLSIHTANPTLRLGVDALAADGDLVVAAVRISGADAPTFLGLRLDDAWTGWGSVDVFRVAGGRIVERWGTAVDPGPPIPLLRVALEIPSPEHRALAVARVTLAPDARHVVPARSGPRLGVAESGTVAVEVILTPRDSAPPRVLRAGEHLVLPAGAAFAARNVGPSPAVLLDVSIAAVPYPGTAGGDARDMAEEGVAVEILADELLVAVPSPSAVLALGEMTLEPGERLDWFPAAGPVLVRVKAGALDLVATGSVPWVDGSVGRRSVAGVEAALAAGDGALLEAGAAAEVRAAPDGPTTLLVLTLLPADGPPPSDAAVPAAASAVPAS